MAINQSQFQAGLSMREFFERYGSEAQCERLWQRLAGQRAGATERLRKQVMARSRR